MNEAEARLWNKTAKYGNTCKACVRVFFLKDVPWRATNFLARYGSLLDWTCDTLGAEWMANKGQ